eukprot:264025-Chlamydomonas_euryale.AAC.1
MALLGGSHVFCTAEGGRAVHAGAWGGQGCARRMQGCGTWRFWAVRTYFALQKLDVQYMQVHGWAGMCVAHAGVWGMALLG